MMPNVILTSAPEGMMEPESFSETEKNCHLTTASRKKHNNSFKHYCWITGAKFCTSMPLIQGLPGG
jgi:hypothetical protein